MVERPFGPTDSIAAISVGAVHRAHGGGLNPVNEPQAVVRSQRLLRELQQSLATTIVSNGMDAPTRRRHRSATVDVSATTRSEGASTMEITTIGLDLA
ncbi:hypothetical protein, partial [Mitsuaria sp. WAJ17]|uniref:hypothetical protein n=1 Tax=Mitsuaria sp. WAJ17 TaxID=2761452 RepID=UPI001C8255A5